MMRRLYSLLIYCAVPFAFTVVLWRGLHNRHYWRGLGERFGRGRACDSPSIWVHAVSLGEMSAAAPLVRALRARYPQNPLVLTTATPTGRARAKDLFGDTADVRFLPYDMPHSVARFLDRVQPRIAIIMETELWPNLFAECERRGVPLVLVNARLSAKSVSRYLRFGSIFRALFTRNLSIAAQTPEDAERFIAIGAAAAQVHVAGNIKFDLELSGALQNQGRKLRTAFGDARPTWIAGSTHDGEETMVLDAHETLRTEWLVTSRQPILLLLAPRHPARFESVAEMLTQRGITFVRRSAGAPTGSTASDAASVLLVDTVGELAALYAAADVAFVGGSLVPVGGHNLLEPAALGLPVLTGPYNSNGKDIARLLIQQGAAEQVIDARELAKAVSRLLADPLERARVGATAKGIVENNRGSVARVMELIAPLLADPQRVEPQRAAAPAAEH